MTMYTLKICINKNYIIQFNNMNVLAITEQGIEFNLLRINLFHSRVTVLVEFLNYFIKFFSYYVE